MGFYQKYKRNFHFPVNFYGFFLLITFIPDILGIPPSIVTNLFWALKAVLAVWIISKYRKKIYILTAMEQLFLFVAFIYLLNIFVDVYIQAYPLGLGSERDFVSFFLSILIAFSLRYDVAFSSEKSFMIFIVALSIGLFIAFFLARPSPAPLIDRFDANSTVNTINYGQMGCALCLASIFGFFNKRFKWSKIIFTALFCLGVVSIMKAGSRSPLVVLFVVGVIYAVSRMGVLKGVIICVFLGIFTWFSLDFIVEIGESLNSGLADRVISAVEKKETSGRDKIYANAIRIIEDAPVFGDFYLVSSGIGKNSYPHNFFLEAFMTTGLLGGIPFVLMTVIALVKSFRLLRRRHGTSWIVLLFLQMVVYGMFSSALYSSQDFWALCLFVLSVVPLKEPIFAPVPKSSKPYSGVGMRQKVRHLPIK